jgi:hypothetical protein
VSLGLNIVFVLIVAKPLDNVGIADLKIDRLLHNSPPMVGVLIPVALYELVSLILLILELNKIKVIINKVRGLYLSWVNIFYYYLTFTEYFPSCYKGAGYYG